MIGPIALLFSKESFSSAFDTDVYCKSYNLLYRLAKERNIDVRFVKEDTYIKDNKFSSYWTFSGEKLIEENTPFTAKSIMNRSRNVSPVLVNRINNPFLEAICRDKLLSYKTFQKYFKKTVLLTPKVTPEEFSTQLVVVKPRFGFAGEGVRIIPKKDIAIVPSNTEYVGQELIDSSKGIPGLVDKRHELRTYVFNGVIKAAYVRLPAPNSYLANVSQGATEMQIELSSIPQSAKELVESVDMKFKDIHPRLYIVDIMYENNKPWIVELNDNPGMPDISVQPFTDNYFRELLNFLRESAV